MVLAGFLAAWAHTCIEEPSLALPSPPPPASVSTPAACMLCVPWPDRWDLGLGTIAHEALIVGEGDIGWGGPVQMVRQGGPRRRASMQHAEQTGQKHCVPVALGVWNDLYPISLHQDGACNSGDDAAMSMDHLPHADTAVRRPQVNTDGCGPCLVAGRDGTDR